MNCQIFEPMISILYDGEDVPPEAARHIVNCKDCRERLRDYAAMAAEFRLLAAQERGELKMQTIPKEIMPKKSSFARVLGKKMRVPRFAAAICALAIVVLAGGWLRTRAQNSAQWFQYRFSFDIGGANGSVGGVVPACAVGCVYPVSLSETKHIAAILSVQKIEGNRVYLTARAKRFESVPDMKHLEQEMSDVPALPYVYEPGKALQVPVRGGSPVEMDGVIAASPEGVPGWHDMPSRPAENQVVVRDGVLIRDGRVIAELPGSASATGEAEYSKAGFYVYIPKEGLFAFGLSPFGKATEASADHGQIRFNENGVPYVLLAGSQITGGTQPRHVWVLHLPAYVLPEQYGSGGVIQFGSSSDIAGVLRQMGAIQR